MVNGWGGSGDDVVATQVVQPAPVIPSVVFHRVALKVVLAQRFAIFLGPDVFVDNNRVVAITFTPENTLKYHSNDYKDPLIVLMLLPGKHFGIDHTTRLAPIWSRCRRC